MYKLFSALIKNKFLFFINNQINSLFTDLGINRSMLTLNKGYSLFDRRVKYNLKDDITVGLFVKIFLIIPI